MFKRVCTDIEKHMFDYSFEMVEREGRKGCTHCVCIVLAPLFFPAP